MPIFDHANRLISCKLVYYGPSRSGKSTNLTYLHSALPDEQVGSLISLSRRRDRTLCFDYIPLDVRPMGSYRVRFQVCTVPGQSLNRGVRQSVLQDADGIAFIADSRRESLDENIDCLHDLHLNLADQEVAARSLPFVFQYNFQNLAPEEVLSPAELSSILNFRGAPEFAGNACDGTGVVETLRALSAQVLRHLGARDVLYPEMLEAV